MGLGLGGIVASGIAGGVGGAGEGLAATGLLEQKQQIEMMREERLSQLRMKEHAANLQAGVTSQIDNAVPLANAQAAGMAITGPAAAEAAGQKMSAETKAKVGAENIKANAGESIYRPDGTLIVTAPIKTPPEQVDYYKGHAAQAKAMADLYNAQAEAIRNGEKYNKTQGQLPNIVVEKNIQGEVSHLVDKTSGAIGIVVPGQAATPGETHWFKPDEPGTPEKPMKVNWLDPKGKPLPEGLTSMYPAMEKRAQGVTSSGVNAGPRQDNSAPVRAVTGKIGSGGGEAEYPNLMDGTGSMSGANTPDMKNPKVTGALAKTAPGRVSIVQNELMDEIANPNAKPEIHANNVAAAEKEISIHAGKPPMQGWSLQFVAQGRAAWVSPDRSQFRPI